MAIAGDYSRPAATVTNDESYSYTGNLIDADDGVLTVDIKDTINGSERLMFRLLIHLPITGQTLAPEVELLRFDSSAAATYVNTKASPFSDAEADNNGSSQRIKLGQQIDLDAIATTAGSPRT